MEQSFIAIYDGKNRFSYLSPGENLAKPIVPFSLSNVFKEFCYDDFAKAVELVRRCGYDKLSRFTQRKRELVPLTWST